MYQRLNGKREGFFRTNSICPTPDAVLLELVLKNDTSSIIRLVEAYPDLLNHIYKPEYNKPILLIACLEENVEPDTIKILIKLGADIHYTSELDGEWQAIHFAARRTNSAVLKVIIESFGKPEQINAIATGSNALHVLIRFGQVDLEEEFVECAKLLIHEGIDVNLGDTNDISPILWAAKKGQKNTIKVVLENSVVPVDIDSHQSRKKTARDIIESEHLYDGLLPDKIENINENDKDILFKFIRMGNENAFTTYKNGDIFEFVNANDTSTTLLQLCCSKGLSKAVSHLLDKGADPNMTTQKNLQKPIEIAAEHGFHEIFKMLLNQPNKTEPSNIKTQIPKNTLITLLKYYENEKFPSVGVDHKECYDYLLKEKGHLLDVNEQDQSKNCPLHYAVRYASQDKVDELLNLGASLGSKNRYGIMPVHDIEPDMLEKHLDNCIQFDETGKKMDREDFTVTFNYKTLIPPAKKIETVVNDDDPESKLNAIVTQEIVAETEVIYYMSKAPEFKHLLQHPVIVSFLFVKWHRIRWLFYTNLAFYIAFFLSMVIYIFTSYTKFESTSDSGLATFCKAIFLITYLVLLFRELFQMVVSPKNYFKNFENYVEIILIIIAGCILFISSPSEHLRKQLASTSILLAAFELILMSGQHPKLSTNVLMLKTVSFNFFKLLIWYSLLIIAFACSFYILFNESAPAEENAENKEEDDFFSNVWKTFFKTIIMTTGEFDAGSINFNTFPVTSKIIFSLFIFMIVIILLNLLNGLAVSDTQIIQDNAELVGHIARAEHIYYVETMLQGNLLPTNIMNKLNELCCCFPNSDGYGAIKPFAKRACIFPHFLDYKMTVYLNKSGQVALPESKSTGLFNKSCSCCCASIYLDKTTVRRTNNIVHERKEKRKADREETHVQKIAEVLQTLQNSIKNDNLEIFLLNNKLDQILIYLADKSNNSA